MPLALIDHEKLEVWKKLRLKLADEHKEDIDRIWLSWSRTLYRKEQEASLESARCLGAGDADLMFSPPNYAPSVVSESSPMVLGKINKQCMNDEYTFPQVGQALLPQCQLQAALLLSI